VVLRRSPSYYIFSLVIPSAFITVVTIVGFFTPHSTTGENTEKVSLGVTALLSMAIISEQWGEYDRHLVFSDDGI
jgi:nicotinic acetylcholine receptor